MKKFTPEEARQVTDKVMLNLKKEYLVTLLKSILYSANPDQIKELESYLNNFKKSLHRDDKDAINI